MNKRILSLWGGFSVLAVFMTVQHEFLWTLYPLALVFLTINVWLSRNKLSPILWLLPGWFLLVIANVSGFVIYSDLLKNITGYVYLFVSILMICLGHFIYMRFMHKDNEKLLISDSFERSQSFILGHSKIISIFAVMGIMSVIMFSIEMLFLYDANISDSVGLRALYLARQATLWSQLGQLVAWGGVISLIAVIIYWPIIGYKEKFLWSLSPFSLVFFSVLSGGRQMILQLLLFFLLSVIAKQYFKVRKDTLKHKRYLATIFLFVIGLSLIGYMFFIADNRHGEHTTEKKRVVLETIFDAEINPQTVNVLNNLPRILDAGISTGIIYFTHELATYSQMWDLYGGEMEYGKMTFPFLARRLEFLGGETVVEAMQKNSKKLADNGYMGVGWSTAIFSFILDFGLAGALIFCFIIGGFSGMAYSHFLRHRSFFSVLPLLVINVALIYSFMLAIISDTIFLCLFSASVLLAILDCRKNKHNLPLMVSRKSV